MEEEEILLEKEQESSNNKKKRQKHRHRCSSYETQDVVPDIIEKLSNARIEVLQNSIGPSLVYVRDPHLRLRRTLTVRPPTFPTGIKKYSEAQYVISTASSTSATASTSSTTAHGGGTGTTTGKRIILSFSAPVQSINSETTTTATTTTTTAASSPVDETTGGGAAAATTTKVHDFHMDAYVFGASEETAKIRMVALHGISPTASRERWHNLGKMINDDPCLSTTVRFVALDWHSIDRSDTFQEEFLTMLPKHYFTTPSEATGDRDDILSLFGGTEQQQEDKKQKMSAMFDHCDENCPRSFREAAVVWKAIIQQGLGWGTSINGKVNNKPFIPCFKSWSGGVGMELLLQAAAEKKMVMLGQTDDNKNSKNGGGGDDSSFFFRDCIQGAVIMHPACFESSENVQLALSGDLPVLAVWAKDDPLVPYRYSERLLVHDQVQLVTYESGGHGSFNGSSPDDPNFDDEIVRWIKKKFV